MRTVHIDKIQYTNSSQFCNFCNLMHCNICNDHTLHSLQQIRTLFQQQQVDRHYRAFNIRSSFNPRFNIHQHAFNPCSYFIYIYIRSIFIKFWKTKMADRISHVVPRRQTVSAIILLTKQFIIVVKNILDFRIFTATTITDALTWSQHASRCGPNAREQ